MRENEHPSLDELADHHAGEQTPASPRIRVHLEHCPECQLLAREMRGFEEIWDKWSLQSHADAYQRARVTEALKELETQALDEGLRARVSRWVRHFAGQVAGAAHVVSPRGRGERQTAVDPGPGHGRSAV